MYRIQERCSEMAMKRPPIMMLQITTSSDVIELVIRCSARSYAQHCAMSMRFMEQACTENNTSLIFTGSKPFG